MIVDRVPADTIRSGFGVRFGSTVSPFERASLPFSSRIRIDLRAVAQLPWTGLSHRAIRPNLYPHTGKTVVKSDAKPPRIYGIRNMQVISATVRSENKTPVCREEVDHARS